MKITELKKQTIPIYDALKEYFSNDVLSCIFAPLFPNYTRSCLWVCERAK